VSIRGIQGRIYYCEETNCFIAIHTEGKFAGQIMKAQQISDRQLEVLQALNKID
jgi:hypothetical protein